MTRTICLILLSSTLCFGQPLSNQATISVVTCGAWQGELYSAFGHSAFRVHDPVQQIDLIYNYGVFDFDQPNFYLNFARGYLYYQLGVHDYELFRDYYIRHDRFIHEQVLHLTPVQTQKLFDYLSWNALPQNTHYRYDYFYNNCATKIRDVLIEVFGSNVTFDESCITTNYTIRQLTDLYLQQQPWGDLGIDICLGVPMDKIASPAEYMFLPDYIERSFDHATIKNDSSSVPLIKNKVIVYESRLPMESKHTLPHPLYVFSVLAVLIVGITVWDLKRKKLSTFIDLPLFMLTGLIGLLLLLLWVATDHQAAATNLNILWALPTHVLVAFTLSRQRQWHKQYFLASALVYLFILLSWAILPQQLNTSLIPVIVILFIRAVARYTGFVKRWGKLPILKTAK